MSTMVSARPQPNLVQHNIDDAVANLQRLAALEPQIVAAAKTLSSAPALRP